MPGLSFEPGNGFNNSSDLSVTTCLPSGNFGSTNGGGGLGGAFVAVLLSFAAGFAGAGVWAERPTASPRTPASDAANATQRDIRIICPQFQVPEFLMNTVGRHERIR